jgi:hypothetical protein
VDGTQLESLDLLSRCALDRPVQGLVQHGPGSLVFWLRNAALLVFHFELKQLILEPFKQELGPPGSSRAVGGLSGRYRSEVAESGTVAAFERFAM